MENIENLLLTKREMALIIRALSKLKKEYTQSKTWAMQDCDHHRKMIVMLDKDENNKLAKEKLEYENIRLKEKEEHFKCFNDAESKIELLIGKIVSQQMK